MTEIAQNKFPVHIFIKMHKLFIIKILLLDIVSGIVGAIYLVLPSGSIELSISNLTILSLAILTTILFQMHFYREYCGTVVFYLLLPIKKIIILPLFFFLTLLSPILFTFISGIAVFLLTGLLNADVTFAPFSEKILYLIGILMMIKVLPLTVMVLIRKHFALLPFFILIIIILFLFLSVIREFVSLILTFSDPVFMLFYMMIVVIICIRIINKVDIE